MAAADNSRPSERFSLIDHWFRDGLGEPDLQLIANQLTALQIVVRRDEPAEIPDEVLTAWHRLIAHQRRIVDQSEPASSSKLAGRGGPGNALPTCSAGPVPKPPKSGTQSSPQS
jgi:hypothetical protein